jgi:hypothetical protein
MKRIIAISDTHMEEWMPMLKLEELMEKADLVTHCGDFHTYEVYKEIKKECELKAVFGNADDIEIKKELPEVEKFNLERLKIGLIHQGNYLNDFYDLGYKAKELGVDILIFGHIHRFALEKIGNTLLISPGSPTNPRLSIASCAEILIDGSRVDVEMKIVQEKFCGMETMTRVKR